MNQNRAASPDAGDGERSLRRSTRSGGKRPAAETTESSAPRKKRSKSTSGTATNEKQIDLGKRRPGRPRKGEGKRKGVAPGKNRVIWHRRAGEQVVKIQMELADWIGTGHKRALYFSQEHVRRSYA